MADNIIIFSGKQYAGKDTAAKIMLDKNAKLQKMRNG